MSIFAWATVVTIIGIIAFILYDFFFYDPNKPKH